MFPSGSQDSTSLMLVDQKDGSTVAMNEMQNGGSLLRRPLWDSKKLQDELQAVGMKIKRHEENLKLLKNQKNNADDAILDLQVVLGKYNSSSSHSSVKEAHSSNHSQAGTIEKILQHEKSAAAIFCILKMRHHTQVSNLPLIKDVIGIVATLGKLDDDNLSRLLSEYLGVETMMAVVCKTFEGVKALETYNHKGHINKSSGLHGLAASIGKALDGRFLVICLESLRPYCGEFILDDPQRRLDLLKPKLPNGECPPGFIGFAVNMIHVEYMNLFYLTPSGYGLRETLFYNLFSRLQVYKTREEMLLALPCISNGAVSLDGGMIKGVGTLFLGDRNNVEMRFPTAFSTWSLPENYMETEKQLNEIRWTKEKIMEDMKRERALLDSAKLKYEKKKEEFVRFLAETSSHASQNLDYGVYQSPHQPLNPPWRSK